jgi:cytochrome c oxidase cbb3-type subunit 3
MTGSRLHGRSTFGLPTLGLVGCLLALAPTPSPAQEVADEVLVEEGAALFRAEGLCFACHGPNGTGVPGAGADLTDGEWLHGTGTLAEIYERILGGVGPDETATGVIMLPRGGSQITDAQARAIAAFVWSLRNSGP